MTSTISKGPLSNDFRISINQLYLFSAARPTLRVEPLILQLPYPSDRVDCTRGLKSVELERKKSGSPPCPTTKHSRTVYILKNKEYQIRPGIGIASGTAGPVLAGPLFGL